MLLFKIVLPALFEFRVERIVSGFYNKNWVRISPPLSLDVRLRIANGVQANKYKIKTVVKVSLPTISSYSFPHFVSFSHITFCFCCFLTRVLSRSGSNGYCCVSSSSASMMMTLNVLSHNGSRTQFHNVLHNSIQTDFKLTIFLERCSLLYVDTPPSIGVGLKTGTPFFSLYTRKKEATMAIAASAKPTESPTTRPVFLPPASSLAALRLVR